MCGKLHHTMLASVPQSPSQAKSITSLGPAMLNAEGSKFKPKSHSMRCASQLEKTVIFSPTTIVGLLNSNRGRHKAITLFDPGSDITLVKPGTAKMLKLDRTHYIFKFGTAGECYCCKKAVIAVKKIVSYWILRYNQPSLHSTFTDIELEKPAHNVSKLYNTIFK